jgi:hypothetical protein
VADSGGYQLDSGGYQPDSGGYQPDSTSYRAASGTASGADWPDGVDPELVKIVDQEAAQSGDAWKRECIRKWRYFAGLADAEYGDKLLAVHLCCDGVLDSDVWPPRRRPPVPELPAMQRPGDLASRRMLSRQLNVRLRDPDYMRLAEAAGHYGLTATTLARLFITRGLEAVAREQIEAEARKAS